jgi:hypothetical protein
MLSLEKQVGSNVSWLEASSLDGSHSVRSIPTLVAVVATKRRRPWWVSWSVTVALGLGYGAIGCATGWWESLSTDMRTGLRERPIAVLGPTLVLFAHWARPERFARYDPISLLAGLIEEVASHDGVNRARLH